MTDLVAIENMSLADFLARSVLVAGVSDDTFNSIREWCSANYKNHGEINMTGREAQHGIWTVRASFTGVDAVKNAALFRMFWG